MIKYVFRLNNLACAGCAAEIEREIRALDTVSGLILDFLGKELTLFTEEHINRDNIQEQVRKIVKRIEPEVEVVFSESESQSLRFRDSLISAFKSKGTLLTFFGSLLFFATFVLPFSYLQLVFYLVSYLIIGRYVLIGAFRKLFSRYIFNEHLLMSIATLGAIAISEFKEAIAVMLFYQIGKFFESKIIDYSQQTINEMQKLKPPFANLIQGDSLHRVLPEKVKVGETILVKAGEKIPLDGIVIEGDSTLDNSLLTGESLPISVGKDHNVSAGAVNLQGVLKIKVIRSFSDSAVSQIIDLVKVAKTKKTQTERFITRFAAVYTPIVLILAVLIATVPVFLFSAGTFQTWFYRSLIFLVISCPCALVISVPLSFFSGLAVMVKKGILVKGALYVENLAKTKTVILDKTGTLTQGKIEVTKLIPVEKIEDEQLLYYAYLAEVHSNHPLAYAVIAKYHRAADSHRQVGNLSQDLTYTEFAGKGVAAKGTELEILAGSIEFLRGEGIDVDSMPNEVKEAKTSVGVSVNGQFIGFIQFADTLRNRIGNTIQNLKQIGIEKIMMLTGDDEDTAERVAKSIGIDDFRAGLLPEDKVKIVEQVRDSNAGKTLFIGDGINDAPSMALADTGMAMGGIGSMAAIESADVILQTDEIDKLPQVIQISQKTLQNARENIYLAIGVKVIFLGLGAFGWMSIWGAVFADVGVTLLAVINSLRLLRYRNQEIKI